MIQKPRQTGYLQVTRLCNNECVFCSNPEFESNPTLENLKNEIIEFKNNDITEIILTGGEPTISPHLFDTIDFISKNNLEIKMISNGVNLANIELVKKLKQHNLNNIHISIHHFKEDEAQKLSQKEGHLAKTLQGIKNCIDQDINVNLNITINTLNTNDLSELIKFLTKKFPQVNHFIFNNLDPGNSDGKHQSRAGKNPWIVAKLNNIEKELSLTANILKRLNKTFRIERVPLCYMKGFEENSTETRKIVKNENYSCAFLRENSSHETIKIKPTNITDKLYRLKSKECDFCNLKSICAGVQKEYAELYGLSELSPSFENKEKIIDKITKND